MKTCCRGRTWTQSRVVEGLVLFLFRALCAERSAVCPSPLRREWGLDPGAQLSGPSDCAPLSAGAPLAGN